MQKSRNINTNVQGEITIEISSKEMKWGFYILQEEMKIIEKRELVFSRDR